ncbi:MAG: putative zinc-dependent protease [Thermoleophilia bacterium]|nr:putative zinc-dependent protease [Thermoleophilia bacterium]
MIVSAAPLGPNPAQLPNATVMHPVTNCIDPARANHHLMDGADGSVRTETLPNGVRLVIAERPGAQRVKLQVGMGAGSLQDPVGKLGLAHLSEHLAFEGSRTRTASQEHQARFGYGDDWNAYTDRDSVIYYGVVPNNAATGAARLINDMYAHPRYATRSVKQERAAVENEMTYYDGSLEGQMPEIAARLTYGDTPATNNVIGTRTSVNRITTPDIRSFHDTYAVGRNTVVLAEGDAKSLPLDTLRREFGKLPPGARVDNNGEKAKPVSGMALQVINQPSEGTVGIDLQIPVAQTVLDELKTPTELITATVNELLNKKLRAVDHITYGAFANLEPADDTDAPAYQTLTVHTQVARNDAQRAVTDLVKTLASTRDGIGAKTLDAMKRSVLAGLRQHEAADDAVTTSDQGEEAFQHALVSGDVGAPPAPEATEAAKLASTRYAVSRTTNAQFARDTAKLVDFGNLKVLAHGGLADGGAALLAGLRDAGIDTKGIAMNPVDLSLYKSQGIPVPADTVPPLG